MKTRPTKEAMIKKWLRKKKRGFKFYANIVAKDLKLTGAEVGRQLGRLRVGGKLKYHNMIWMVV